MSAKISKKVLAAVVATGLLSFCGVIIETAMNVTFPTLMKEFSISTSTVQWMTSSYLLVVAIIVPTSAVLKKSFKTKTLFTTANLFFVARVVIDALAPSFPLLLLGRAIQGVGTGIALPLMFNIILEQVPKSRLGLMMGVGNLITGIAPAIGPTFGGIIATKLSWRWVFYLILPLLIISFLLGRWGILQKARVQKQKLDFLSMLLIAITFTGLVTGFAFLLPNYVQLVNGNTAMTAGLLVLPAGFAGAIFAPLGGRILDRFGARRLILVGMSLCLRSSSLA